MNNFEIVNPTKIIFGENKISSLKKEIPKDSKILLLYGKGSIKKNGVYSQVLDALKDYSVIEFSGITPNPEYTFLLRAVDIIRTQNIDYLLAVGGGSVIDATKFLSATKHYKGNELWEIVKNRVKLTPSNCLPFATILTTPATSSEMNGISVISNNQTLEKISIYGIGLFPKFSIIDPNVVKTIPKKQIANGIGDTYMHVLEQYITNNCDALIQYKFSESILKILHEITPRLMSDEPFDYNLAANFAWTCTWGLNGFIGCGITQDWIVHTIGHELTSLFGIEHCATLAIVVGPYYEYRIQQKKEMLAQYAERIWNITQGSSYEKAVCAINLIIQFYNSLGIKTKISDYVSNYSNCADIIGEKLKKRNFDRSDIGISVYDVVEILKKCY